MPLHDVNDAFSEDLMDDIVVIRQVETISSKGRGVLTPRNLGSQRAVVTAASPDDLARIPEDTSMGKAVSIYTPFRLQGPSEDEVGERTQPDQILWHGSTYEVRLLDDYSAYGRGFVHAVATSIITVDPPPFPSTQGSA